MDEKKVFDMNQEIANKAFSQKKINVKDERNVKEIVDVIFNHINHFNSLEADTAIINQHPLADWVILNEFSSFIYPNSVRYESGNRIYLDLLYRSKSANFEPNFQEYIIALSKFRGLFKKDALTDITNLSNLRVDKSFEEVRPNVVVRDSSDNDNGMVRYLDKPFIPVPIKGLFNFVDASIYLTASQEQVIRDFICNMTFI